ncbi:MAG: molybdopterin-dependent oxidoreductase [Bryobacteraceae bacterium]
MIEKLDSGISRRRLFRNFALLVGAAPLLSQEQKVNMVVRSVRPRDLEMPLDGFGTWITPVERFFVRTHVYEPQIDVESWKLRIDGEVETPLTLTLDDLRQLPKAEVVGVLECAGNGRSFFEPTVIGMQWTHGGVGNGRWAGARLGDVLKKAGIKSSAKHILFDGADVPIGTMPDFTRTVPLKKSLDPSTLLAYEMNGQPLPAAHGFPLRVVAPGWAGDSWVKWITHIQALDREHDGFFMKTAYRYPVRPVAPGEAVDAANLSPVEALRPKSVIASPVENARLPNGPVRIQGAAWSGESPIVKVEVSTDSGRTWRAAQLGPDRAKYAWRLWEARWSPPGPGSYLLMARATDASGQTQPFAQDWNPSGYLWNVVAQTRVEVGGSGAVAKAPEAGKIPPFPDSAKASCIGCHEADIIAGQRLTRAQWEREVNKMVGWGAKVKPEDRSALLDFLTGNFGPRR